MNELLFSSAARSDLQAIAEYGERVFGAAQSESYRELLRAKFEQIAENPLLFPRVDEIRAGYRRAVVGSHSVFFRIEDQQIQIVRILRGQVLPASLEVE
ncbi:MAG: type II toxin-antitoxin system RelE/ParE family toxin [bacterium]